MAKKEKDTGGAGIDTSGWMVTFSDLLSLLLTFFVMLLTMKSMDTKTLTSVTSMFDGGVGVLEFSNLAAIKPVSATEGSEGFEAGVLSVLKTLDSRIDALFAENQKCEIQGKGSLEDLFGIGQEGNGMGTGADLGVLSSVFKISEDERGVVITLEAGVLFEGGNAEIRPSMWPLLDTIGKVLKLVTNEILVMGHTDDRPIRGGVFRSNWELSLHRALNVHDYLVSKTDISPKRVFAGGYGDLRPRNSNETAEGREKNRRVEIVLRRI